MNSINDTGSSHRQTWELIPWIVNGRASDEERRMADEHLRGCAECTAVLNDLKRVVARAQGVAAAPRPPAADLWAGIAARVESPGSAGLSRPSGDGMKANVTAFAPRAPRRVTFTLPQLAAAAAVAASVPVWRLHTIRDVARLTTSVRQIIKWTCQE